MVPPIFLRFTLFLISTHSENLINSALILQKFKILEAPFEENLPFSYTPKFVKFYLFFIFAYSENFMCLASVVKIFEF